MGRGREKGGGRGRRRGRDRGRGKPRGGVEEEGEQEEESDNDAALLCSPKVISSFILALMKLIPNLSLKRLTHLAKMVSD